MRSRLRVHSANWLTGGAHFVIVAVAAQADSAAVWPYALAAMSVVSFVAWVANYRRYRYIADTPTSRIASAAQGYVELLGRAAQLPGAVLLTRFRRLPCVWYRYQVQEKGSDDKWSLKDEGESDDPFLLSDATGQCVIDPEQAEIITSHVETWTEGDYRYTESLLLPQDKIYALGDFSTIGGAGTALDFDGDVGALLTEWKKNQPQLLERFDLNRDNSIDLKEWQLARRQAQREVERQHQEMRASSDVNVMRRPADGRLFLLSNQLPEKLILRYQLWSCAHIVIFLGAGGWSFALFS
ncbi:MAG: hypothetical protein AAB325_16640 [Pseudomonadota bacterium]